MRRRGETPEVWRAAAICAGLAALVWLVFGQTVHFDYLNYDDNAYVFSNPRVLSGISARNIAWAFTHPVLDLWTPVTVISHMLDCQLFGRPAAGHHFMNVLIHASAAVLLFVALWQLTGAIGRSGFVAAVFAIHPLRVESVAWIAERKDVLDALSLALTLLAYAAYVRKPTTGRYVTMGAFLALGLMAKPMLVTVPFILLLLDYWPLGRLGAGAAQWNKLRDLIQEKAPLFFLAIAAVVISIFGFKHPVGEDTTVLTLPARLGNGVIAAVVYLRQLFAPVDAGVIHCIGTAGPPMTTVALCAAALLGVSAVAIFCGRRLPFVAVGWLWYIVMLIPVCGFASLGFEARADRYTYLPQIGLVIAITWLAAAIMERMKHRDLLLGIAGSAVIAALGWRAHADAAYWRNSETLWTRTLAMTSDNLLAEENISDVLMNQGRPAEATPHFLKALALQPKNPAVLENLGAAYFQQNRLSEAMAKYAEALEIAPDRWSVHDNIGLVLARQGDFDDATAEYQKALTLSPDEDRTWNCLGDAASGMGKLDEAESDYRRAIALNPYAGDAHDSLGVTLLQKGLPREAKGEFESAIQLNPNDVNSLGNLAMLLASAPDDALRNGPRAVELASRAEQLGGHDAFTLSALAAAYAETGRFQEAVATARQARQAAADPKFAQQLDTQLGMYEANRAFRDESLTKSGNPGTAQ